MGPDAPAQAWSHYQYFLVMELRYPSKGLGWVGDLSSCWSTWYHCACSVVTSAHVLTTPSPCTTLVRVRPYGGVVCVH